MAELGVESISFCHGFMLLNWVLLEISRENIRVSFWCDFMGFWCNVIPVLRFIFTCCGSTEPEGERERERSARVSVLSCKWITLHYFAFARSCPLWQASSPRPRPTLWTQSEVSLNQRTVGTNSSQNYWVHCITLGGALFGSSETSHWLCTSNSAILFALQLPKPLNDLLW